MNSRERVLAAINHMKPDRIPLDLGSSGVSGIHCKALYSLRERLGLDKHIIKAIDPVMMLGEVEEDVRQALGIDIIGLHTPNSPFGYRNDEWKLLCLPDGTEVYVGVGFNVTYDSDGAVYAHPGGGDVTKKPSLKMPAGGFYFDNIFRQQDLENHVFNARVDYANDFKLLDDATCHKLEKESKKLFEETEYAIFGSLFPGCFGDFFQIAGAWLDHPQGIRRLEDWMIAHYTHPDYIEECFDLQTEIGLKNLELYKQAVGEHIHIIAISATDFGTQNAPLISPATYKELYKKYHKKLNDWVHENTNWKTFCHSCGCTEPFIEDFIEAGFDILNPIQISAKGMEPALLKEKYGGRIVFWGGAVNPQETMPFGTPDEVRNEVLQNISILGEDGGYICGNVHCIQAGTPPENILALYETVKNR